MRPPMLPNPMNPTRSGIDDPPTRLGAATLPHDCHTNQAAGRVVDLAGLRGWAGRRRVLVGVAERRVVVLRRGGGERVLVRLALAADVLVLGFVCHARGATRR